MSRARRRRRSRGGDNWLIGLGVLAGLVALGVLGGMAWLNATVARPPTLEQATLCPADGPSAFTVVLLDASDAVPEIARRQIATALSDLAESVPEHGLLEVRMLDGADLSGRLLFSRCNPGDGEGLSEWTANPAAARRRWMEDFRQPIAELLAEGIPGGEAPTSPIMATIQGIAVDRFYGRAQTGKPKSLVVVSDMIENTPDYNQYRAGLDFAAFRQTPAASKYATDLGGVDVTVYYLKREGAGPAESGEHIRFWSDWISDNGGRLVEAVKLQGLG
jgi:hypothetical protein